MTPPTSWYLTNTYTLIKRRLTVPPTFDKYGNDVYAETPVPLTNALFDAKPVTSVVYAGRMELTDREEHITEFGQLFMEDPATDIASTDKVVLDSGPPFDVLGAVERHTGSRTGIDYCMVTLRRVSG